MVARVRSAPALLLTLWLAAAGIAAAHAQDAEPEATPAPEAPTLAERAEKEVTELHAFFEAWFNGTVENTDAVYARLTDVLADGFAIIGPAGNLTERAELVDGLRAGYAPEGTEPIRLWIEGFQLRHELGDTVVVTYQEWQQRGSDKRGRLSTAVLHERPGTPNGLEWIHVHSTWLPR
jgi:hypothetical protein